MASQQDTEPPVHVSEAKVRGFILMNVAVLGYVVYCVCALCPAWLWVRWFGTPPTSVRYWVLALPATCLVALLCLIIGYTGFNLVHTIGQEDVCNLTDAASCLDTFLAESALGDREQVRGTARDNGSGDHESCDAVKGYELACNSPVIYDVPVDVVNDIIMR